jgi:outer membrane protein assembly factor BamB
LFGVDGTLICVDASNGQSLWKVDANRRFGVMQNFFGVGSNPIVSGDLLIVRVGGSSPNRGGIESARGNGSGIVAFDKHSGEVKYQFSDELSSYASLKQTTWQARPWCFAFMRGGLLVFDPRNAQVDFFFPWRARVLESVNASVPVVFADQVLISETYGPGSAVLNFTRKPPVVVWQDRAQSREKAMQTHWNTAIHHEGYIYGSSGRHTANAELRCIQAESGKVMWSEPGLTRSSLLYVDDHFVCLSEDGMLRLVRATPQEFEQVTSVHLVQAGRPLLTYPAWAAPVLSHGLLYVRGEDRLVCTELIPK